MGVGWSNQREYLRYLQNADFTRSLTFGRMFVRAAGKERADTTYAHSQCGDEVSLGDCVEAASARQTKSRPPRRDP